MTVDIYVKEASGGRQVRIPWLPDKVTFHSGGTRMAQYEILDEGEVEVPTGSNLETVAWSSKLPGEGHKDLPFLRGTWQDPKKIQNLLTEWKEKGTPLVLIMTGTPINYDVYLKDFNIEYEGGSGDYTYEIEFKKRRDIKIIATKVAPLDTGTTTASSGGRTHTVKSGDTLWALAQKYYGSGAQYKKIYNANQSIIESTAKKYGKSSSDGGHWIYPGTTLQIP